MYFGDVYNLVNKHNGRLEIHITDIRDQTRHLHFCSVVYSYFIFLFPALLADPLSGLACLHPALRQLVAEQTTVRDVIGNQVHSEKQIFSFLFVKT